ncbi:MAG: tetratricopeptide repeat protein [candidate division WOR-3 bacterium]|uniref:Tetratricopeptide repeat protein n=1 Tax=candidate division WOR-3 bacterium TaxID=2052148 RepID=A0A7V3ZTB3_UNCW3
MRMVKIIIILNLLFCATPQKKEEASQKEYEPLKEAKASYIRALSYYQQGKFEDALNSYKEAYKLDPNFIDALIGIGNTYIALRKYEQADSVFSQVIFKYPDDSRGYEGLGFLYGFCKKDYGKGKYYYLRALERKKDDPAIIFNLATLSEDYDKNFADSLYRFLLSKNPDHAGTIKKYTLFLIKEKRYKDALIYAYKAESLFTEDVELRTRLVELFYNTKEYKKALENVDFVISKFPQSASLYIQRGDIYSAMGNYSKALLDYDTALKIEENNILALLRKSELLVRVQRPAEGINIAQRAINLGITEPELKSFAYAIIGDGYKKIAENLAEKGEKNSAINNYKLAINYYEKSKSAGKTAYYSYSDANIKICEEKIRKLLGIR